MADNNSIKINTLVKDLTDRVFGRWHVISFSHTTNIGHAYWNCVCECGTHRAVSGTSLIRGSSKSCGCFNRERAIECSTKHGKCHTPEYRVWKKLLRRCYEQNDKSYHNYGGRGIAVCDQWRNSFESFINDMGTRPSKNHSIDRIDNDGNYEPNNCRWATPKQQSRNRRVNIMLTCHGKTMCISDWSREVGITIGAIKWRLKQGWSIERALTEPRRHRHLPDMTDSKDAPS